MNRPDLEKLLVSMKLPAEGAGFMAAQLEKRARQLSEKRGQPYEETLAHLIALLKQGWLAKQGKKPEVGSQELESGIQKAEDTH